MVIGTHRYLPLLELENVGCQIDDDGARNDDNHGPQKRRKKSRTRFVEPRFIAPVLGHGQSSNSVSGRTTVLRCDLHESPPPIVHMRDTPTTRGMIGGTPFGRGSPLYRGGILPSATASQNFSITVARKSQVCLSRCAIIQSP